MSRIAVTVSESTSIDATVRRMATRSREVDHPGIAVALDDDGVLLGVVTDGDIRRAYASDIDFSLPVSRILVRTPITVPHTLPPEDVVPEVHRLVKQSGRQNAEFVRHVLVVDEAKRFVGIHDFLKLLSDLDNVATTVAVFGLGYVGLTLAVSLANQGHQVTGVDIREDVVKNLSMGKTHVLEPGLADMLQVNLRSEHIRFAAQIGSRQHSVYIVAVGTPLDQQGRPNLKALSDVGNSIAGVLRRGDLVMLRSTVPVGTTREVFVPLLEKASGLEAGADFNIAFAPERTAEGRAMRELRTLPQVVGGLTPRCTRRAAAFWSTLTPSVVQVSSPEIAEMVKLANNSFRDLSFAFANELALLADRYNVNAFEVVQAANEGYPRNPIAMPSPGVGGYCLTKDPHLFGKLPTGESNGVTLGAAGRGVNERAALYPTVVVERFCRTAGIPLPEATVLLIGIAFKGEPETDDVRGSVALDVAAALRGRCKRLLGWDAVLDPEVLRANGLEPTTDLHSAIGASDAVLIMNNHVRNVVPEAFVQSPNGRKRLIFDGWNQLNAEEMRKVPDVVYATMGYMSPP